MKKDRINVSIEKETHTTLSQIAGLLGLTLKEAVEQSVADWSRKVSPEAQRRYKQVLKAVA